MNYSVPEQGQRRQAMDVNALVNQRLRNSMLWMVVGLLTTVGTMVAIVMNPSWLRLAFNHFTLLLVVELVVVFIFSAKAYTASPSMLKAMFFIYSILNGFTLLTVSLAYGLTVAGYALIGTLAFFISFAVVGMVVKRDLTSLYPYLMAALVAMILTTIAMFFMKNTSTLSLVLGYLGVIVFSIFTAVDINRIKQNIVAVANRDETVLDRIELIGALSLYLDFINLFLSFLRIFGGNKSN